MLFQAHSSFPHFQVPAFVRSSRLTPAFACVQPVSRFRSPQAVGSVFPRLVLFPTVRFPLISKLLALARLPRLSRFALLFPFGFRLRSYLFGPPRLLPLSVPSPAGPSSTVRHLSLLPLGRTLSSLRFPSYFLGSVRFPRCFAFACIVQPISFPFRFLPVLSGTFSLSALSNLPLFQVPSSAFRFQTAAIGHFSHLIQPLAKFSLCSRDTQR